MDESVFINIIAYSLLLVTFQAPTKHIKAYKFSLCHCRRAESKTTTHNKQPQTRQKQLPSTCNLPPSLRFWISSCLSSPSLSVASSSPSLFLAALQPPSLHSQSPRHRCSRNQIPQSCLWWVGYCHTCQ